MKGYCIHVGTYEPFQQYLIRLEAEYHGRAIEVWTTAKVSQEKGYAPSHHWFGPIL